MRFIISSLLLFLFFNAYSQVQKVLIIGIDGCRADALEIANTPNLDLLMANGTFSYDALNDDVTYSGPGWSAMLTGVWSDKHGVTNNTFLGSDYDNYPHFFEYVEAHNPNLNTASISHWNPINDQIVGNSADYKLNVGTDSEVATEAAAYLQNNDSDVLFLHFDDCDGTGHSTGFSPNNPAYINTIETTDAFVGIVLNSLYNRPNYANENWLILCSTDHGGNGTSHGGTSFEEERIFLIASGDQIPNQQILPDSTLIPIEGNCLNATNELTFDGNDDYVEIPNPDFFNFGSDQDFTIECRVRTTQAADVAIIGNKNWDSGINNGFIFSFKYASGPEWKVNVGDGLFRADINTGGAIADDGWHTLTVTFDRDGDMVMYEDGVYVDDVSLAFIGDINSGYPIRFGTDPLDDYAYQGSIAEVRIWNTVLDANTIADWHCTTLDNTHPDYNNLLGYWPMDEGTGADQVKDMSDNSNHGTINNASWINSPLYTAVYDYSATPRITDVALSALAHLCIPLDPNWNLDGKPIYSSCPVFSSDCSEAQYIIPYIYQNRYQAIESVLSDATIDGTDVEFKAANYVELQGEFEVKTGASLDVMISPCNE